MRQVPGSAGTARAGEASFTACASLQCITLMPLQARWALVGIRRHGAAQGRTCPLAARCAGEDKRCSGGAMPDGYLRCYRLCLTDGTQPARSLSWEKHDECG